MQITKIITAQRFGIPVSIGVAILIWLTTTTMTICSFADYAPGYTGLTSWCETDSLLSKSLKTGQWPLQYFPFTAYWDAYDDKLLWFTSEFYNRLVLIGLGVYAAWFGISYFVRVRKRRMTARPSN